MSYVAMWLCGEYGAAKTHVFQCLTQPLCVADVLDIAAPRSSHRRSADVAAHGSVRGQGSRSAAHRCGATRAPRAPTPRGCRSGARWRAGASCAARAPRPRRCQSGLSFQVGRPPDLPALPSPGSLPVPSPGEQNLQETTAQVCPSSLSAPTDAGRPTSAPTRHARISAPADRAGPPGPY